MKSVLSFLILFVISLPFAHALTFTALRESPDGGAVQKFSFNPRSITYVKTTNFFDIRDDYRIGEFIPVDKTKIQSLKDELVNLYARLEKEGSELKKLTDIGIGDLAAEESKVPVLLLGGHKLHPRTEGYKLAYPILEKLLSVEWKLQKGVSLLKDGTIEKFSAGRKIASRLKQDYFRCKDIAGTEVCQGPGGVLYLK